MFGVFIEACKDTYVRSCTPAPKTPAGDVIVTTVQDTLAATGGTADQAGWWIAGFFGIGALLLFIYNDLRKRDRQEEGWEYGTEYEVSSTESVFEEAENEAEARKLVEQSPYDTGLVRRRIGSDFWVPFN